MTGTVRITVVDGIRVQGQIPGPRTRRPAPDDGGPIGRSTEDVRDHEPRSGGCSLRHGPGFVLHGHASHRTRHFFSHTQHFDKEFSFDLSRPGAKSNSSRIGHYGATGSFTGLIF